MKTHATRHQRWRKLLIYNENSTCHFEDESRCTTKWHVRCQKSLKLLKCKEKFWRNHMPLLICGYLFLVAYTGLYIK